MNPATEVVHVGPAVQPLPVQRGGAIERRMMGLAAAQVELFRGRISVVSVGENRHEELYDGVVVKQLPIREAVVVRRDEDGTEVEATLEDLVEKKEPGVLPSSEA